MNRRVLITCIATLSILATPAFAKRIDDDGSKMQECWESCTYGGGPGDWCAEQCTRMYDNGGSNGGGDPERRYYDKPGCRYFGCENERPK